MSIAEAMREIESHGFAARLNLGGNISEVLKAAHRETCVKYLLDQIQAKGLVGTLLLRTLEIARQRVDPRYENPWDAAITVYLFLLNQKSFEMAKAAASAVDQIPRLWWARQYSDRLLRETPFKNNSGQHISKPFWGVVGQPELVLTAKSSESLLDAGFTGITPKSVCVSATQVQLPSLHGIYWSSLGQEPKYDGKNGAPLPKAA